MLGVIQELDGIETRVALAVGYNDCLVSSKVGGRHGIPFGLILAHMG